MRTSPVRAVCSTRRSGSTARLIGSPGRSLSTTFWKRDAGGGGGAGWSCPGCAAAGGGRMCGRGGRGGGGRRGREPAERQQEARQSCDSSAHGRILLRTRG